MTPIEIVQKAIPGADDALCDHIVWGRTGFPSFWKSGDPAREIFEAARRFKRAEANGRRLCDHCDREVTDGNYCCPSCSGALEQARS